ncbi:MAG TPA: 3-phosphoshikimate 1-carboxyvinyltransferase [Mycobacteriales bacterium]|nr:3-phosphoshikimate 1-carboxyvinyltransferase [Mycobacteriales bacterium]
MTSAIWEAPYASSPVIADVRVPASKSMTNRALALGSIATAPSTLRRPLRSRDTELMAAALRAIGAAVDTTADDAWIVTPATLGATAAAVDVGNAGTVLRFAPPIAALTAGTVAFDGDEAARRRPVGELLTALRTLGAEIDDAGEGRLPFTVTGRGTLPGGEVAIDASSSSQLVSGLLVAGARYDQGVTVQHTAARAVPNQPHIAMTVAMLRDRGVTVEVGESATRWRVSPGPIGPADEAIEPDLSSAAPFLAAAVVTGGRVRVPDWPRTSTQPGALLPKLLERFGATVAVDDDGLTVTGGRVTGADLDLRDAGELTPVLAAVAAVADGPSTLTGIDYLRGHETDRLAALSRELGRLGADVAELADGLTIRPKPLRGARFATYDDHRLAMAAAVIGLVVPGVLVENVETTAKTFPAFAAQWSAMAAGAGVGS